MSEQREFMKRTDLLVILVLAGIFLGGCLWMRSRGSDTDAENYAVMSVGDQIVEVWPLAEHHNDLTIDLSSYGFPGKAEFHDGAVRVIDVDCPDKVCESMGYVASRFLSKRLFAESTPCASAGGTPTCHIEVKAPTYIRSGCTDLRASSSHRP